MPALKTEIFEKRFTTVPRSITASIRDLCREVSPDGEPQWVRVEPDALANVNECFNNVADRVRREGGTLVYGWTIWEWPRVMIEAEHHAVWETGGRFVDITPHANGEAKIVFLPDPDRRYDFEGKKRLINHKRSLGQMPSAERWIAASDELQRTIEEHSVGEVFSIDRRRLQALWERGRQAQAQVLIDLALATRVNAPCFCGSGHKFKKCCALLIDLHTHVEG